MMMNRKMENIFLDCPAEHDFINFDYVKVPKTVRDYGTVHEQENLLNF